MMTDYRIRALTIADEPFLWEMLYQAIFIPVGGEPLPRNIIYEPEISCYVKDWGQEDDSGFVAIEASNEAMIGAAWIRRFRARLPGYGFIDECTPELTIAVAPEYRGQGIGTELLSKLLHSVQSRFPAISLSVSAENPAARLYVRLGFTVVGQNGTSLTMVKNFRP